VIPPLRVRPELPVSRALQRAVREHYDRLSGQYLRQWGEHIHHGLFDGAPAPTPADAQLRLVEHLAARAAIARGSRVLDVGCGFGGSTRWLAERLECRVVGLTISPVQARTALRLTARRELAGRAAFALADAERLPCAAGSVDAVWVVECSEHLADKATFLAACAQALRPGGVLALCAWLAPDECAPEQRAPLAALEEAMVCPSLGSWRDY
jgi:tocopherol O-methyltransferase